MVNNSLSAFEALTVVESVYPPSSVGALTISSLTEEKEGTIYFKDGLAYAVKVVGHRFPIALRASSAGEISDDDLSYALGFVDNDITSYQLPNVFSGNQLISKQRLEDFLRDNFLSCVCEILSWEEVVASWEEEAHTQDFTIGFVPIKVLKSAFVKRKSEEKEALRLLGVNKSLFSSSVTVKEVEIEKENYELANFYQKLQENSQNSLDDHASALGMTRFTALKNIFKLYNKDALIFEENIKEITQEPSTYDYITVDAAEFDFFDEDIISAKIHEKEETSEEEYFYSAPVVVEEVEEEIYEKSDLLDKSMEEKYLQVITPLAERIAILEKEIFDDNKRLNIEKTILDQKNHFILDEEEEVIAQSRLVEKIQKRIDSKDSLLKESRSRLSSLNDIFAPGRNK